MSCLDGSTDGDARRALEDALRSFVVFVPLLMDISEELRDAHYVHFPGGIEASVVEIGKGADGRGEMTGETDRTIEQVGIGRWYFIHGI